MKNTLHCKSQLKRARAAPNVPVWESLPCIVSYLDNLRLLSNLQSWGLTRVCVWQREEQTEKGFTLHAAGVIPDNFILNSFQLSWRSSVHPGHYFNIFPVLQFIAVSWFFNHYLHESFHSTPAHLRSLFFFLQESHSRQLKWLKLHVVADVSFWRKNYYLLFPPPLFCHSLYQPDYYITIFLCITLVYPEKIVKLDSIVAWKAFIYKLHIV